MAAGVGQGDGDATGPSEDEGGGGAISRDQEVRLEGVPAGGNGQIGMTGPLHQGPDVKSEWSGVAESVTRVGEQAEGVVVAATAEGALMRTGRAASTRVATTRRLHGRKETSQKHFLLSIVRSERSVTRAPEIARTGGGV